MSFPPPEAPPQKLATGSFVINKPSGLALDAAGDLYILSFLGPDNPTYNAGEQVVIVPAASPTTPYILPNTGIGTSSSMAFDPSGNMDVLDSQDGAVIQLSSTKAVFMGNIFVGKTGLDVLFNFEFNAPANLRGFQVVTQGDVSSDLLVDTSNGTVQSGTTLIWEAKVAPLLAPTSPTVATNPTTAIQPFPGIVLRHRANGPGKKALAPRRPTKQPLPESKSFIRLLPQQPQSISNSPRRSPSPA